MSQAGSTAHAPAVAADPRRPGVVYVALADGGILASADRGRTWKTLSGPPDTVLVLAIDPVKPTTLYAGTKSSGVYKSTDSGAHWKAINRGIHPALTFIVVALAIDPRHPQTVFFSSRGDAPYRSMDGGGHWTKIPRGLGSAADVRALAVDPAGSSTVFAGTPEKGVFRSTDGGLNWKPAGSGLPDPAINILLAAGSGLFAGSQNGVAASRDLARSWTIGHNLQGTSLASLAIDSQNPPRMYAFDGARLFKSASRGASWTRLAIPEDHSLSPTGPMVIHPGNPQEIELGYVGSVARSDDGGHTWGTHFDVGCVVPSLIVIDPSDPEIVYTSGGYTSGACRLEPGECSSYKFDHGQTSCVRDDAVDPRGMRVIAVDPATPSHLFAGLEKLYQSMDAGVTWTLLSAAIQPYILLFDPVHPGTLYASMITNGVARSVDNGATWQASTAGLPPDTPVLSLAIDPNQPSTLYAATLYAVYRSTDSGDTWAPLGTGLEEVAPWQLVLDPLEPGILYAATLGGGVMRLRL